MSSSPNEAARGALSARLPAALALSAALHVALMAALEAPATRTVLPGVAADALRVLLREAAEPAPLPAAAPERPAARPAAGVLRQPAAVAAPSPLPPRYYATSELDVRPGIMTRVEPEYPQPAAWRGLSGSVRIRLLIDETGTVESVAALSADPPGFFEESAERAFRAARFTPGMRHGVPVRVQMVLEVSYEHPPLPR